MGFKDGTQQPKDLDAAVWVGEEGPDWMQGGSYLVVRKIRIALEHWDRTPVDFQEQTIGRQKYSGSPLGGKAEFDPLDLAALELDRQTRHSPKRACPDGRCGDQRRRADPAPRLLLQ